MYQLKFNIHSYWRVGTGRGTGALLDEVVHKDVYGLPCLPGRSVKGLLRNAVYQAEQWKLLPEDLTHSWFGGDTLEESRLENEAGALGVSDASLDDSLRNYFIYLLNSPPKLPNFKNGHRLRQGLFDQIEATAIEYETGAAKKHSLRKMEVTIPLTLTAQLRIVEKSRLILPNWDEELTKCLPLIRAVGSSCSRGLGRVTVTLEKSDASSSL